MIGKDKDKERWRDLCKRAVREHDLGELLKLIEESHHLLVAGEDQREGSSAITLFTPKVN
jgi:hypothetical protein